MENIQLNLICTIKKISPNLGQNVLKEQRTLLKCLQVFPGVLFLNENAASLGVFYLLSQKLQPRCRAGGWSLSSSGPRRPFLPQHRARPAAPPPRPGPQPGGSGTLPTRVPTQPRRPGPRSHWIQAEEPCARRASLSASEQSQSQRNPHRQAPVDFQT